MIAERPALLITDDDVAFRETLRDVFDRRGYRTLLAGDGEEALTVVSQQEVHVLLLDMHMPRLTGLETIRRVKRVRAIIPCILISAALSEALAEEARRAKAFSALSKPISLPEVTNAVSQALRVIYDWPAA